MIPNPPSLPIVWTKYCKVCKVDVQSMRNLKFCPDCRQPLRESNV